MGYGKFERGINQEVRNLVKSYDKRFSRYKISSFNGDQYDEAGREDCMSLIKTTAEEGNVDLFKQLVNSFVPEMRRQVEAGFDIDWDKMLTEINEWENVLFENATSYELAQIGEKLKIEKVTKRIINSVREHYVKAKVFRQLAKNRRIKIEKMDKEIESIRFSIYLKFDKSMHSNGGKF